MQYGNFKTYTNNKKYPNLYSKENGSGIDIDTSGKSEEEIKGLIKSNGIDRNVNGYETPTSETSSEAKDTLTATQTYYSILNATTSQAYFKVESIYSLLFTGGNYWIASRYINCQETEIYFGLFVISPNLGGFHMMRSGGGESSFPNKLRPVVTLDASQITLCVGENSENNMHTIKSK